MRQERRRSEPGCPGRLAHAARIPTSSDSAPALGGIARALPSIDSTGAETNIGVPSIMDVAPQLSRVRVLNSAVSLSFAFLDQFDTCPTASLSRVRSPGAVEQLRVELSLDGRDGNVLSIRTLVHFIEVRT